MHITPGGTTFDPYNLYDSFRVEKIATPLGQVQLAEVLCRSHEIEYGRRPSDNKLALSWAQVALENNRGKKVWNNNLGNQGPFRMDQEYYHHLRKGWPYRSFRSYNESGRSYWRVIEKCSQAWRFFEAGDPKAAAFSLHRCNYFAKNPEKYATVLSSLYYEAKTRIVPYVRCSTGEGDR